MEDLERIRDRSVYQQLDNKTTIGSGLAGKTAEALECKDRRLVLRLGTWRTQVGWAVDQWCR